MVNCLSVAVIGPEGIVGPIVGGVVALLVVVVIAVTIIIVTVLFLKKRGSWKPDQTITRWGLAGNNTEHDLFH